MATPTLTPQNDWYRATFGILNGSLPKEHASFYASANAIYTYVAAKNNGRCYSKNIHDEQKRNHMIEKLFKIYENNASVYELCRSSFMRKIVKHDRSNDQNLTFIFQEIVPVQISNLSSSDKLSKDLDACLWLMHLNATTIEPAALQEQKLLYESIPNKEYRDLLSKGRAAIGTPFKEAILKGWIDAKEIDLIREALQQKVEQNPPIELTQETAVAYFVYRYREVIASGGEQYAELFYEAIHKGLNRFKMKELDILKKSVVKAE